MTFGSVCSGIEAASAAWIPLGWQPRFVSEIESFCCSLLKEKHPTVKNYGDFTTIGSKAGPIDVLVGGTPCQDFSVAGLRAGMAGERGNLTLEFVKLAGQLRPEWLVWENVPGVLSIDGGRAFGAFLGGLAQLGYGFAYRVLDAQYFGVPQRRRRVFVVGYLGDWRPAAAVLFERDCLSGNPAPRREAGQGFAADFAPSLTSSGRGVERGGDSRGQDPVVAMCLNAKGGGGRIDGESETFVPCGRDLAGTLKGRMRGETDDVLDTCVTHSLRADGLDASEDGTGRGTPLVPIGFNNTGQGWWNEADAAQSIRKGDEAGGGGARESTLVALSGGSSRTYVGTMAVRRLTPRECERLQGFPDNYTLIQHCGKPAADGPRYKALGNSMAVPVMRWIGERIQMVQERVA